MANHIKSSREARLKALIFQIEMRVIHRGFSSPLQSRWEAIVADLERVKKLKAAARP